MFTVINFKQTVTQEEGDEETAMERNLKERLFERRRSSFAEVVAELEYEGETMKNANKEGKLSFGAFSRAFEVSSGSRGNLKTDDQGRRDSTIMKIQSEPLAKLYSKRKEEGKETKGKSQQELNEKSKRTSEDRRGYTSEGRIRKNNLKLKKQLILQAYNTTYTSSASNLYVGTKLSSPNKHKRFLSAIGSPRESSTANATKTLLASSSSIWNNKIEMGPLGLVNDMLSASSMSKNNIMENYQRFTVNLWTSKIMLK